MNYFETDNLQVNREKIKKEVSNLEDQYLDLG